MINLHTHTLLSDGVLLPAEIARRAEEKRYSYLALTDHIDNSNIDVVIPQILKACKELNEKLKKIKLIPGIELTHIPPKSFIEMTNYARNCGIKIVVAHGETIIEPVAKGTNKMAILAKVDILAHPGIITEKDIILAKENNVYLEITSRKGHSLTNGHIVSLAKKIDAKLVLNSDTHSPDDLLEKSFAEKILEGAGIEKDKINDIFENSMNLVKKILKYEV